jgi:hypothetical protein
MTIPGPLFISHSSLEGDDVVALCKALRAAFDDKLRMFNTSSGTAIQAGDRWRNRIIEAIQSSSVVVLWATPAAIASREVAFEIGAAFACSKVVLPCAIHIKPSSLPWSLSELQVLMLDQERGWLELAAAIANVTQYPGSVKEVPLLELAARFTTRSEALRVSCIGYTVEFLNTSKAPIMGLRAVSCGLDPVPTWVAAVEGISLEPGKSSVVLRDREPGEYKLQFTWTDVTGGTQRQEATIKGTPA